MTDAGPSARPSHVATLRARVEAVVERAWARAIAGGTLPALPDDAPRPAIELARPTHTEYGDFATNLAMKLARPCRMAPLAIASALAAAIEAESRSGTDASGVVASAKVAPPGFLNLRLADAALEESVAGILAAPAGWGRMAAVKPLRINVEFVSANPT